MAKQFYLGSTSIGTLEARAKLESGANLYPIMLSTNRPAWFAPSLVEHIMKKPVRTREGMEKRATVRGNTAKIVKREISTPGAGEFTVVDVYICKKLLEQVRKTPYFDAKDKEFWVERVGQTLLHNIRTPDVPNFVLRGKTPSVSASIKHSME